MEKRSEWFFLTFVGHPIPFTYIPPTGNECGRKPIATYVISRAFWTMHPSQISKLISLCPGVYHKYNKSLALAFICWKSLGIKPSPAARVLYCLSFFSADKRSSSGIYCTLITCWEVFMDFTGAHVRRPSPYMWKNLIFFAVVTLRKSDTEIKSWPRWNSSRVPLDPKSTKPQGSWQVQLIEKAICLWFLVLWWIWASTGVFRCQHVKLHL